MPADAPELRLSKLLDEYRKLREQRLSGESKRKQAAAGLLITGLQQRLLSSIEAFARTLRVHRRTVQRQWEQAQTESPVALPAAGLLDLLAESVGSDDERAVLSDCFETFAFPAGVLEHAAGDSPPTDNGPLTTLEIAGREYYEFRAALMVHNNDWMTKTYNRFHDPDERSADVLKLRELHAAMDRAVLEAYGWHDLAQTATCEFLLDYEEDEDDEEAPSGRRRTPRSFPDSDN